jgi:hypothetical protein
MAVPGTAAIKGARQTKRGYPIPLKLWLRTESNYCGLNEPARAGSFYAGLKITRREE